MDFKYESTTRNKQFSIEMQKSFTGYHDPTRDWIGWDCPLLEWGEAKIIAQWVNEWSGEEQLQIDHRRKFIVCMEDPDAPIYIEGDQVITDEGVKRLYPVGTGWWIWSANP